MPFKKGIEWKGYTGGRRRKLSFADYWSNKDIKEVIKAVKRTYKKKPEILKLVIEQLMGKAQQNINLGGQEDKPIPILFKLDKPLLQASQQLEANNTALLLQPNTLQSSPSTLSPKDDTQLPLSP